MLAAQWCGLPFQPRRDTKTDGLEQESTFPKRDEANDTKSHERPSNTDRNPSREEAFGEDVVSVEGQRPNQHEDSEDDSRGDC